MKVLKISPDLVLPADDAVVRQFAWLGRTGSGKSFGCGRLVEELIGAKHQVVILDWIGIWWALRLAADGKSPGLDVRVFGGLHGDVPLEPGAGALVAQVAVDRGISMVLDLSLFRKNGRRQFGTEFAEELFERKKRARSPMHVVIEECQEFAPQYAEPQERRMLGAYEDLGKIGRNYGIGWSAISQRPQAVAKELLSQADPLMVFQTSGAHERKAIRQWIDEKGLDADALFERILKLPVGRCCFWSPQWLGKFLEIGISPKRTFNASATPKRGEKAVEPRPLSADDLKQLTTDMAAVVDRAKATDPKALQAEIAALKHQLAARPVAAPSAPAKERIVRVDVPVIKPRQQRQLEKLVVRYEQTVRDLNRQAGTLTAYEHSLALHVEGLRSVISPPKPCDNPLIVDEHSGRTLAVHADQGPARPSRVIKPDDGRPLRLPGGSGDLGSGERKVLHAIRMFPNAPARVGFVSGYVRGGSTYRKYVSTLRSVGLVERGVLQVTAAGAAAAGPVPPSTIDGVLDYWRARLGAGERRIFDAVLVAPTAAVPAIVAEQAGFELGGSTWRKYVSTLRSLGLLVRGRELRAAPELFA